jgi:hypothetical protein
LKAVCSVLSENISVLMGRNEGCAAGIQGYVYLHFVLEIKGDAVEKLHAASKHGCSLRE